MIVCYFIGLNYRVMFLLHVRLPVLVLQTKHCTPLRVRFQRDFPRPRAEVKRRATHLRKILHDDTFSKPLRFVASTVPPLLYYARYGGKKIGSDIHPRGRVIYEQY